jgi:rubrerythrin
MNMNDFLDQVYAAKEEESHEKVAEQAFRNGIVSESSESPFSDMSLDELVKLAKDLQDMEEDSPEDSEEEKLAAEAAELNKTAAAMFGGQMMAHAVIHEFGLIKEAVANGVCRVCKTHMMDIESSSICSACMHGEA